MEELVLSQTQQQSVLKNWNDAVKEDNMGDPRGLASAFYRNATAYGGVVLQIGNAYGGQACRP
mgnify:CR=1 FL=1